MVASSDSLKVALSLVGMFGLASLTNLKINDIHVNSFRRLHDTCVPCI